MNTQIIVKVDVDFENLIPDYLENLKKEVKEYRRLLKKKDFLAILSWSHKIKSSGPGYGFDKIGQAARTVENAAKNQDETEILNELTFLTDYLEQVEPIYVELEDG